MKSIKALGTKGRLITAGAALMASLTIGVAVYVPAAEAVRAGENLIDGDFEEAMLKHFEKRFFKRIDATEDQQSALSTIFLNQMQSSRSQREAIRHKLIDLSDYCASDSATDEQIKNKVGELRTMREKLADSRIDVALKVRKILTPDQRKHISDHISNFLSGNSQIKRRVSTLLD
jgi:Spy/CpxP family protein refolding chaperone